MANKLYIVGTPIGNLGDISPRALEILEKVDFIAAEDTRVTLKLLNHFNIKNTLVSYHEHNKLEMGERITERILSGESCALVTDAGMPAISDPGEDLVRLCIERGAQVESVPGPCAFATALALSGMPARRFTFEGFLPQDKKEKSAALERIKNSQMTVLLYEAPHRLSKTLCELYSACGDREIAIVREITKLHEQVIKTTLFEASEKYKDEALKGEIVLVIGAAEPEEKEKISFEEAVKYAFELIRNGESKASAAKMAAAEWGYKRNEIYRRLTQEDD